MFRATLICCDGDCAEEFEAFGSLDELQALACDCGCSLELTGFSEVEPDRSADRAFELVPLS